MVTGPVQSLVGEYATPVVDPVSLVTAEIRKRSSGTSLLVDGSAAVSTRFCNVIPANRTAGSATAPDAPGVVVSTPVWVIDDSHSVAAVPSPGAGIVWASDHESTGRY